MYLEMSLGAISINLKLMIWGKADKKYIRRKTFLLFVPRFHLQLLTRASDIRNRNVIYRVKFKSTVITFPFVFFIR